MAWTEITRAQYQRAGLRYASDVSDAEWALLAPGLPGRRRLGRPRTTDLRAVLNAILYLLATGCQWRALPHGFPPRQTVQGYFYRWRGDGTWPRLSHALVTQARLVLGRTAAPRTGIIDSQSVRTTESGGPRGRDVFKRLHGRKRHIVTDTQGFLLAAQVRPANIQDSHAAVPVLSALRRRVPSLQHILADRIYRGPKLRAALAGSGPWTLEIVQRPPGTKGFQLLPRRWVVERTFAWFGRNRRLAKDYETNPDTTQAWLFLANIKILTRRLANPR